MCADTSAFMLLPEKGGGAAVEEGVLRTDTEEQIQQTGTSCGLHVIIS